MNIYNDPKTISVAQLLNFTGRSEPIPIMLKSKSDNVTEIKNLFEGSGFLFAHIDLATVNESIDLILKISMFCNHPEKKKVVFFFDNFEKADNLAVMYLFSSVIKGTERSTFYKENDVLLFNTYSSAYDNVPTPLLNKSIHVSLD